MDGLTPHRLLAQGTEGGSLGLHRRLTQVDLQEDGGGGEEEHEEDGQGEEEAGPHLLPPPHHPHILQLTRVGHLHTLHTFIPCTARPCWTKTGKHLNL